MAKYGTDSTLRWVKSVTGDGAARGIAVDGAGRAYVSGFFYGSLDLDGDGAGDLTSAGEGDIFIFVTR